MTLVVFLYCLLRTGGWVFLLKHDKSYLPIVPKTVAWAQHLLLLHYLLFTYFDPFSHTQPIVSACNKGDKLKEHQQLTFEFFSRIRMLISPPPPSFLKRQRFQNFVKCFDHIKCKNTKPFSALSNSCPFNFTP